MKKRVDIVIYNDNAVESDKIVKYIQEYYRLCENREIVLKVCSQSEEFWESNKMADIYFLGEMKNGLSLIDIAKRIYIKNSRCCMILFANTDEYALDAFYVKAIHYLLRPITQHSIYEALERCEERFNIKKNDKKIICQVAGGIEKISYDDIIYIESQQKYQKIELFEKSILLRKSLGRIYEQLKKEKCFIMPHRSFIVNMKYIKRINVNEILTVDDSIIPLPRGTYKEIEKNYLDYCMNNHFQKNGNDHLPKNGNDHLLKNGDGGI